MRFLIVDDSNAMRMIMKRTLRQAGFDVSDAGAAANPAEAMELLKTETFDLVLSDWNMPGGKGIDLLRDMRASGDDTKLGFVTSESSDAVRKEAFDAGAEFIVVKPFDADKIGSAVSRVAV